MVALPTLKTCCTCGKIKDLSAFHKDAQREDGLHRRCKDCHRACMAKYRIKNQAKIKMKDAEYREANREKIRKQKYDYYRIPSVRDRMYDDLKKYRKENPLAHSAHQQVAYAVQCGEIIKPRECSCCGKTRKLDGHHGDYRNPLDVSWLCRSCHQKKHRDLKDKESELRA